MEGGAYFKARGIILMKLQNIVVFSFQINNKQLPLSHTVYKACVC